MNFKTWEEYILHYCQKFCMGMITPRFMGKFALLCAADTNVVFSFSDYQRRTLEGVMFFSGLTRFRMHDQPSNAHERTTIPCHTVSINNVETFLNTPMIYGCEERKIYVGGKHLCTGSYSLKTGVVPFYQEHSRWSPIIRLKLLLGYKVNVERHFFKGVLTGYGEKVMGVDVLG